MWRLLGLVLSLASGSCWRGVSDCYASFDCAEGEQCVNNLCESGGGQESGLSCHLVGGALSSPPGATPAQFGFAVSLSATTLLIGDPAATPAGMNQTGAAYATDRASLAAQQANFKSMLPPGGTGPDVAFGQAVALQGPTAWIGAPYAGMSMGGTVFTFAAASGTPSGQHTIPATGAAFYGSALAADDSTVLVVAPGTAEGNFPLQNSNDLLGPFSNNNNQLAVAVFGGWGAVGYESGVALLQRVGTNWTLPMSGLALPAPSGCLFPVIQTPVALSATDLLVSCQRAAVTEVWRYSLAGTTWSAQSALPMGSGTGPLSALALGDNLAVVSEAGSGRVWALKLKGQAFSAPVPLVAPGTGAQYGAAVATAAQWVAVGAPGDGTDQKGRVYVFDCSGN